MFYIIDFDTGIIESKSKTETPLLKYIVQNKLELSVALVSSTEEIYLKLSLQEMKRVWKTNGYVSELKNEEDAAERLFFQIHNMQRRVPTFTKKLGQQLIKDAKRRCSDAHPKRKPIKLSQTKKEIKQLPKRFQKSTRKETSQLKLMFGKFK